MLNEACSLDLENVINSNYGFHQLCPDVQEPCKDEENNDDNSPSKDDKRDEAKVEADGLCSSSHIPLTPVRLDYLLHLLDNVKKFV